MKRYVLLGSAIAVLALFLSGAQLNGGPYAFAREEGSAENLQADTDKCLNVDAGWDRKLPKYPRFKVNAKNSCSSMLDIRICIQQDDGKWNCGLKLNVNPGESSQYSSSKTTERYKVMSRRAGSRYRFPDLN